MAQMAWRVEDLGFAWCVAQDEALLDRQAVSDIRRAEALAREAIQRNGGARLAWVDMFSAAAEAQMGVQPRHPDRDALRPPRPQATLGRRSRLEMFHRHGPAIDSKEAEKARIRHATLWIDRTLERLKATGGRSQKEGIQVAQMSDRIASFLRSRGIDPRSGAIYLLDSVVQHFRRDAKRDAGIALPEEIIRQLPEKLENPKTVLWDRKTEDKPALLYVFDVPGDARLGKVVVRVEFRARMNQKVDVQNSIASGGLVPRRNLADVKRYELVEGEL